MTAYVYRKKDAKPIVKINNVWNVREHIDGEHTIIEWKDKQTNALYGQYFETKLYSIVIYQN